MVGDFLKIVYKQQKTANRKKIKDDFYLQRTEITEFE